VLLWTALIIGVVALVRQVSGNNRLGSSGHKSAEELLAQRFARSEIDEAEYRQRLAVLADRAQAASSP
jgi:putative membrane protein